MLKKITAFLFVIFCFFAFTFSVSAETAYSNIYTAAQLFNENTELHIISPPTYISGVTQRNYTAKPTDVYGEENGITLQFANPQYNGSVNQKTSMFVTVRFPSPITVPANYYFQLETQCKFYGMPQPQYFSIDLFNGNNVNVSYNMQSNIVIGGSINKYSLSWKTDEKVEIYGFRYVFVYPDTTLFKLRDITLWQQYDNFKISVNKDERQAEIDSDVNDGNKNINKATSTLPNDSEGILNAYNNLVTACSTTSTECNLVFPAIKIPAIPHLFNELTVSQEHAFNFSQALSALPPLLINIVHILFDIALVLFCFKELYSTIQYVITLNNGGAE